MKPNWRANRALLAPDHAGPIVTLLFSLSLSGCAILHHAQVGEIDDTGGKMRYFDIKVSETGVNIKEAGRIAKALGAEKADEVADFVRMFQLGPRTGNPVYVEDYAENIIDLIRSRCPSGKVTGLTSIRETRSYPVISGEIVKITGYCKGKR